MKAKTAINPKGQMLTTTEAAERLRMERNTLMKKCAAGLITCIHPGKLYLIPESEVDDILARKSSSPGREVQPVRFIPYDLKTAPFHAL